MLGERLKHLAGELVASGQERSAKRGDRLPYDPEVFFIELSEADRDELKPAIGGDQLGP